MAKNKKQLELEGKNAELTADLQRIRADFENYRKRIEQEKEQAKQNGRMQAVLKMLPVIDTIERAISHTPADLKEHPWVVGVKNLEKNLEKLLKDYNLEKMAIKPGVTEFNPDLHEAISSDDSEGDKEVVTEVLQTGYLMDKLVLRHAMVRVGRE